MARRNILLSAILIVGGRAIGGEECLMYGLILAVGMKLLQLLLF